MKVLWVLFTCMVFAAGQVMAEEKIELKTQKDKTNYAIGRHFGEQLKINEVDLDPVIYLKGIKDGYSGDKTLMTDRAFNELYETVDNDLKVKMKERNKMLEEKRKVQAEKNKKEGEAFLEKNKKLPGVKTLPSGLQYKVITKGKGKSPTQNDTITINDRITSIDGTEIDNTYKEKPVQVRLGNLVKGLAEGLQLMQEGARWQLFVPANLSYERIPLNMPFAPNAVLIYDVELIKVEPTPAMLPLKSMSSNTGTGNTAK